MDGNMRAELCVRTLDSAAASYPALRGAVVHSDRGSQYTSGAYRAALEKHGIRQSMNSDGGRCHDNARCEKPADICHIKPNRPLKNYPPWGLAGEDNRYYHISGTTK